MVRIGATRWLVVLIAACLWLPNTVVVAQSDRQERLYGNGAHAYFEGQFDTAMKYLQKAAELGSQDPRVFYFRGLCHAKMGDLKEAQSDFALAADLEFNNNTRVYPVNNALERVQGPLRMLIEMSRNRATSLIAQERQAQAGSRDSLQTGDDGKPVDSISSEPRVQRMPSQVNYPDVSDFDIPTTLFEGQGEQISVPPEALLKPTDPMITPPTPPTFAEDQTTGGEESETTEPAETTESTNPFGGGGGSGGADDSSDPFGGGGDSNSDDSDDDGDPFGG